eukprot:4965543-Alexandrium_andersonii.AAC.1
MPRARPWAPARVRATACCWASTGTKLKIAGDSPTLLTHPPPLLPAPSAALAPHTRPPRGRSCLLYTSPSPRD